jgi:hypothetical protein
VFEISVLRLTQQWNFLLVSAVYHIYQLSAVLAKVVLSYAGVFTSGVNNKFFNFRSLKLM